MPVYLHSCLVCGWTSEDLLRLDAPEPDHCNRRMVRRMPAPFGRVAGSPFVAAPAAAPKREMLRSGERVLTAPRSPVQVGASNVPPVPETRHVKRFEDCTAAERTERWRDTTAAMTAHQVACLELSGTDPSAARSKANQYQQSVTETARAQLQRPDGKT